MKKEYFIYCYYSSYNMVHLRIGDEVPDFEADSSVGNIKFHEYIADKWCIFFSHPSDYTPVCTTELGATAKLSSKFLERNVLVCTFKPLFNFPFILITKYLANCIKCRHSRISLWMD